MRILVAHATPPTLSDLEGGGGGDKDADGVSVVSGHSDRSKTTSQLEAAAKLPWYRNITCKDLRDIMPTFLILVGGLLVMIFVIPYAFSSVIQQLENAARMDRIQDLKKERAKNATAEAARNATLEAELSGASESTPEDSNSIPEKSRLLSSDSLTSYFSEWLNT